VIAREGYLIVAGAAVLALVLAGVGLSLDAWYVRYPLIATGVGALAFTLFFFRDPERTPPEDGAAGRALLAPADGRVVEVVEEDEPLYLDGPAQRISIFLSPLNVHVNRIPTNGVVEYARYRPGDYLVAWHPKASDKNERSEIGLRHPSGTKVLFKQIAGAVARRIVYHVGEGDTVQAGERFGIVKFGSRMDVLVPPGVELDVEKGQSVRGGTTVLGRLPEPGTFSDEASAAKTSAAKIEAAE
jgi:phosphatidylserine decarboxylase